MSASPVHVLIVGAGPTGLALACQCLKLGLNVRLIEKKSGPSTTSKALGLQYRVSEVLACMGVVDRFVARGGWASGINLSARGRNLLRLKFQKSGHENGRDGFAPRVILLPQSETEEILGDIIRERGGKIEWGVEFLQHAQDASGVSSRIRHADGQEEEVRSDYLVSCEGAHSVIRKQTGIAFQGKTYPLAFVMADVRVNWTAKRSADQVHVWLHQDGSFAAMPLPSPGRWRLFFEMNRERERLPAEVTLDTVRALVARRLGEVAWLSEPTWISEFRIHCRLVDRYRCGRIFLAGDAAHIHSPTGGQGITTGLQDAFNLAWKLARVVRGAPDELLDTYQEERLPRAREVLHETDRATSLLFAPNWRMRLVRDLILLPVMRLDWVQRLLFSRMAQLHVHYRSRRLSRHQDSSWFRRTRVKAGDRAPDICFRQESTGEKVTLFQLLQTSRPVALVGPAGLSGTQVARLLEKLRKSDIEARLVVGPDVGWEGEDRLIDEHGDFRRIYGMTGQFLCLVRPDDHVGLFQRPIREGALEEYLRLLRG